jgi:protease-4
MPAASVYAERTTITGSIGVYAAMPDVSKLANDHGVSMVLIKAGDIKGSGSPFMKMTPQERQPWQDMVDHAYDLFLKVVEDGRKDTAGNTRLKKGLRQPIEKVLVEHTERGDVILENGKPKTAKYDRKLADGGTYTADEALQYGLIDQIGYLEDAAGAVAQLANLADYQVVTYDRPATLLGTFLGVKAPAAPATNLDLSKIATGAVPRVWYLAPQSEFAGLLTAAARP